MLSKDKLGAEGKPLDGIPFHPYYIVKDVLSVAMFLAVFAAIVFFVPLHGMESGSTDGR